MWPTVSSARQSHRVGRRSVVLRLLVCSFASSHRSVVADLPLLDDFVGFPSRNLLVGCCVQGRDRVAWVESQRGRANIWASDEGEGWTPRMLTNYTEDDGGAVSFLEFALNGSALVFHRGAGAGANPRHLATLPAAASWVVPFAGGEARALTGAEALALSGGGAALLFAARGGGRGASASLWEQGLGAAAGEARRLFSVQQGDLADPSWRPGGGVLAFANGRGDHGFVGLYSRGSEALVWVAPSVDTDLQPAWAPGGRSLAWVRARLPPGNVGFSPFDGNMGNRGPDFSIMVAEVSVDAAGRPGVAHAREVFRDDRYGMLVFGFGQRPLLWLADDVVLFGTEALSGWGHAVVLDVGSASPGPREVRAGSCEDLSWSVADGWIYLVSNCLDPDGVGVERFRASDLRREAVGTGALAVAGASDVGRGLAPLSRHVAFLGASFDRPAGVYVVPTGGGGLRSVTADAGFDAGGFVRPQVVKFNSSDGLFTLHGQLFLPHGGGPSGCRGVKVPGIVYTHGGSERQMYPAFHYSGTYAQEYAANQWLASQGFAVLSVNYRSGTGYGHDFRVCDRCMARGAAEYMDVRQAAVYLGSVAGVDADRIGIWGLSYGGLNAEQACSRDSGLFKACVTIAGIFNWVSAERYTTDLGLSVYDADEQPELPGGFRSLRTGPEPAWAGPDWSARAREVQALMLDSSPAGHLENLTSPMLLIHGDADEEVDFQETLGAVRAVRALGRGNVEAVVVPDEGHGFVTYAHQAQSLQATGDFLERHLRGDCGGAVLV